MMNVRFGSLADLTDDSSLMSASGCKADVRVHRNSLILGSALGQERTSAPDQLFGTNEPHPVLKHRSIASTLYVLFVLLRLVFVGV